MRATQSSFAILAVLVACSTGEQISVGLEGRSLRVDSDSLRARYGPVQVGSASVPFDKPYGELTRDEQRAFKRWYERMAEADEPPFHWKGCVLCMGPLRKRNYLQG